MLLKRWSWAFFILGLAGLWLLLSNGSQKDRHSPATSGNQAASFSLQTQSAVPVTQKDALGTRIAEEQKEMMTRAALTAAPTIPPGPPPVYPTYTPWLGMLPGEPYSGKNPDNPQILNAWRRIINGETLEISAGREGKAVDLRQGVVMVNVWYKRIDTYRTPQRVGPVLISAVNGTLVTVVSQDGQHRFVFDIGARTWLSP